MPTKKVPVESIVVDPKLLPRTRHDEIVEEYVEIKRRLEMPPIKCIFDGKKYWLYDGLQRFESDKQLGEKTVVVDYEKGSKSDVPWLAAGANCLHGHRLAHGEKRKALILAINSPQGKDASLEKLANHIGCSLASVKKVRADLKKKDEEPAKVCDAAAIQLDGSKVAKSDTQMEALAKLPEQKQVEVAKQIASGKASTVQEAVGNQGGRPTKAKQATQKKKELTDRRGKPAPEFLRDVIAETTEIQALQTAASDLAKRIEGIKARCPSGAAQFVDVQILVDILKDFRKEIDGYLFHATCPECAGNPQPSKHCACQGRGWYTYNQFSKYALNVA